MVEDRRLKLAEKVAFHVYARTCRGLLETHELTAFIAYGYDHLLPRVVVVPQAGYTHKGETY